VFTCAKRCPGGNNQTVEEADSFPSCRRTNNQQPFPDSKRLGFLLARKSFQPVAKAADPRWLSAREDILERALEARW